jgi:uncharacterized protein
MNDPTQLFFASGSKEIYLLPRMANRHGLIAGATGTGKTISLKVMAESFSAIGVPVFLADVKGDLASICMPGESKPRIEERIQSMHLENFSYQGYPTTLWDVFGKLGHPVRTSVSDMGPLLISRLLGLNETQSGVLNIIFKIADDQGTLLIDLKDLKAMLMYVGDNATLFTTEYGNISKQSIGAIQRGLLTIDEQGGDQFFGEPAMDIRDMIKTDERGFGYVNVLAAEQLINSPALYSTFLLWLLSELFEELPEVGDLEKPKIVFFFDEAHLLFDDVPKVLLDKIEQVVRLVRSKGVGVYFITQNPTDIPDTVLGQLGNKVQHALRAFTPKEQAAIKAASETFRPNPELVVSEAILDLRVGEALISFLDAEGRPSIVERAFVMPPHSFIGTIQPDTRARLIIASPFNNKYESLIDRDSAYEMLQRKANERQQSAAAPAAARPVQPIEKEQSRRSSSNRRDTPMEKATKSFMSSVGRQIGREVVRGLLGSFLKK